MWGPGKAVTCVVLVTMLSVKAEAFVCLANATESVQVPTTYWQHLSPGSHL